MNRRFWSAAATAVIVGLFVAACGGGGSAAPGASATGAANTSANAETNVSALRGQVVAAVKQASSVHVSGSFSQGAQQTALDAVLTRDGGIGGRLSVGGHSVALRTSRGHAYILVSKSLSKWQKIPPQACAIMCGKWLKESDSSLRSLAGDAGWAKIVAVFQTAMARETADYGGKATVNGQPALKLSFSDATVYVAAHGTPYPLRIQAGANQLVYSDWNTAKLPPPPPASKVITTGQLATGG